MSTQSSAVEVFPTAIPEIKVIIPSRYHDYLGFCSETYNRRALSEAGFVIEFVQDNHSFSSRAGTLRGLHFQTPPYAQAKLVRVAHGAVLDVAADLRRGSPTLGRHVMVELSASNWKQLLIPRGFAHGFLTLVPNSEVIYKVDAYYSWQHDHGLRWDDPDLAIPWPLSPAEGFVLSARDRKQPLLKDLPVYFVYGNHTTRCRNGPEPKPVRRGGCPSG